MGMRRKINLLKEFYDTFMCAGMFFFSMSFVKYISLFQSNSGWKYAVLLDENMKTHPLMRPFKTLSEKVMKEKLNILFRERVGFMCSFY